MFGRSDGVPLSCRCERLPPLDPAKGQDQDGVVGGDIGPSVPHTSQIFDALADKETLFLGSGPNRGLGPVEQGEILSVCLSICPYIHMSIRTSTPGLLAGSQAFLAGSQDPL